VSQPVCHGSHPMCAIPIVAS